MSEKVKKAEKAKFCAARRASIHPEYFGEVDRGVLLGNAPVKVFDTREEAAEWLLADIDPEDRQFFEVTTAEDDPDNRPWKTLSDFPARADSSEYAPFRLEQLEFMPANDFQIPDNGIPMDVDEDFDETDPNTIERWWRDNWDERQHINYKDDHHPGDVYIRVQVLVPIVREDISEEDEDMILEKYDLNRAGFAGG